MKRIFLAWELGGGLGHLLRLKVLAEQLVKRGASVTIAACDVVAAQRVFQDCETIEVIAAPEIARRARPFPRPQSYAHLLANVGFADGNALDDACSRWRELLNRTAPSLVICDHAPTLLLALRELELPRITIGTGFCCPPRGQYLPLLRPWEPYNAERLRQDERELLGVVNSVLLRRGSRTLGQMSDLYAEVTREYLLTYPQLDHFNERPGAQYHGVLTSPSMHAAENYPAGDDPKIFTYLKRRPGIEAVVAAIQALNVPTLIVGSDFTSAERARFQSKSCAWTDGPIDIESAIAWSDLVVTQAGHGTLAAALLAGKPIVAFPALVEQFLGAHAMVRIGAGLLVKRTEAGVVRRAVDEVTRESRYRSAARKFAEQYAKQDRDVETESMVTELINLAR